MSTLHVPDTRAGEPQAPPAVSEAGAEQSMRRPFLLVMVAIAIGLGGLYLVRAALVDVGGFTLGSSDAPGHLVRLAVDWRFLTGGALLVVVLLISLELYGSEELSKIVPLYSLSYVLIALIGQLFLDERVTLQRWFGIVAIVTGVVMLLRS
jgi:drug/metabolite transporter (DMT)-like permease